MKTIVSALAIAAASTALAVESSNTFGILRVDSSDPVTIVAVPWVAAGTGAAINIADVVKTANLNNGDVLHYYNGTSYDTWVLTDGAWAVPTRVGEGAGVVQPSTLPRGGAIILERKAPQGGSIGTCFYLYGQYESTAAAATELPANAYSLIAPPKTDAANGTIALASATWTGITSADHIILPNGNQLDWNGTAWGKKTYSGPDDWTGTWSTTDAVIPMGQGVWFKAGTGDGKTVQW